MQCSIEFEVLPVVAFLLIKILLFVLRGLIPASVCVCVCCKCRRFWRGLILCFVSRCRSWFCFVVVMCLAVLLLACFVAGLLPCRCWWLLSLESWSHGSSADMLSKALALLPVVLLLLSVHEFSLLQSLYHFSIQLWFVQLSMVLLVVYLIPPRCRTLSAMKIRSVTQQS